MHEKINGSFIILFNLIKAIVDTYFFGGVVMLIKYEMVPGTRLTEEQIQEIELAKKKPIVFDEDAPELTPEMIEAFRRTGKRRGRD